MERIAAYYEQRGQLEEAADMRGRAEAPEAAVRLYLQVGTSAAINKAIALVEAGGGDAQLAAAILAALDAGGKDGGSAGSGGGGSGGMDERAREELRFRLHMAMGRLGDAGRSALESARTEQVRR
jgi:hypothetical protein